LQKSTCKAGVSPDYSWAGEAAALQKLAMLFRRGDLVGEGAWGVKGEASGSLELVAIRVLAAFGLYSLDTPAESVTR